MSGEVGDGQGKGESGQLNAPANLQQHTLIATPETPTKQHSQAAANQAAAGGSSRRRSGWGQPQTDHTLSHRLHPNQLPPSPQTPCP